MSLDSLVSIMVVADALLRANRTPGTPPGDKDDVHEDNTFNLPNGNPIRRAFKRFAARQLKKLLGTLPAIGAPLPDHFPPLADWTKPMAAAMTPLIGLYWDEGGRTTRARLGLDPDAWEVHDPHLHEMIEKAAFRFCRSTNETTDLQLNDALERLRGEFLQGLVTKGETIPQLTARVKTVFKRLSDSRAEMIARTESSRAVHAASLQSAKESGVVAGKKWLVSANSCDKCQARAAEFNGQHGIPLDESFGDSGSKNPAYSEVPGPPLHPHCRCSITYVLTPEYEAILAAHPPGSEYQEGSFGPEPGSRAKAKAKAKPAPRPKPAPPPEPAWTPGTPIRPELPIGERIRLAKPPAEKLAAILRLQSDIDAVEARGKAATEAVMAYLGSGGSDPATLAPLQAAFAAASEDYRKAKDAVQSQVDRILKVRPEDRPAWKHLNAGGDWGPATNAAAMRKEGGEWIANKLAAPGGAIRVNWESRAGVRAYANEHHSGLVVAPEDRAHVHVHELGHHVEFRAAGAKQAAFEFLAYRVGSEPLRPMSELCPMGKFGPHEMGRKDDFEKAFGSVAGYVGKDYTDKHGARVYTEIISMGVEKLYTDPLGFAKSDPEYCKFILGILDGSLRSP